MTDFKKPKAAPGRPQSGLAKLIPHTGPSSGSPSQGQGTLDLTWARQGPTSCFWNIGVSISELEPGTERQHSNKTYGAGWEASMHNPPSVVSWFLTGSHPSWPTQGGPQSEIYLPATSLRCIESPSLLCDKAANTSSPSRMKATCHSPLCQNLSPVPGPPTNDSCSLSGPFFSPGWCIY